MCDLGLDRIYTYRVDRASVSLVPSDPPYVETAPASGPRHFAFGAGGRHAYAINELDNTLVAYDYLVSNGGLVRLQAVSVLPTGHRGEATAAEVRVHPNGRFVYGSCRGPDTISVFSIHGATGALAPIETVPCGGRGPRSFSISPDGRWLVCAHQDSGTPVLFQIGPRDGPPKRGAGFGFGLDARLRRLPGLTPSAD